MKPCRTLHRYSDIEFHLEKFQMYITLNSTTIWCNWYSGKKWPLKVDEGRHRAFKTGLFIAILIWGTLVCFITGHQAIWFDTNDYKCEMNVIRSCVFGNRSGFIFFLFVDCSPKIEAIAFLTTTSSSSLSIWVDQWYEPGRVHIPFILADW